MKWEIFAASRPQNGRTQNEDDFFVGRGVYPVAALADGAGNANLAARKALAMFSKFHSDTEKSCPMDLLTAETGRSGLNCWIRICLGVRSQLFAPSRLERLRILRAREGMSLWGVPLGIRGCF